jgi:hypothetical protein
MSGRQRITITYVIIFLFAFERCAYNDIKIAIDCTGTTLAIELVDQDDVSNCRAIDGSITVSASGGLEPYDFKINDGDYQTNNVFNDLGAGVYTVHVKDMNGCEKWMDVSIGAAGSTLNATVNITADNQCTTDNGTATINVTGGVAPYQYQLDAQGYGTDNVFSGLKEGQHVVVVKDDEDCQRTISVVVPHGNTGTSYGTDVKSIITASCALSGCHGAGTGSRDWTVFSNVKNNAANIKARVVNRTMPPSSPLPQAQIDVIRCWVDDGALDN